MPIYEYKCENCGEVFEVIQKFADAPVTVHEKCGGPVRRLMSSPSFQFKGSGWYVNDYGKGSNGSKKTDSKESKEGKESKPSTETKSETKSTESKPSGGDKSKSE
jgi:putative FmdB family regulatory protein